VWAAPCVDLADRLDARSSASAASTPPAGRIQYPTPYPTPSTHQTASSSRVRGRSLSVLSTVVGGFVQLEDRRARHEIHKRFPAASNR